MKSHQSHFLDQKDTLRRAFTFHFGYIRFFTIVEPESDGKPLIRFFRSEGFTVLVDAQTIALDFRHSSWVD